MGSCGCHGALMSWWRIFTFCSRRNRVKALKHDDGDDDRETRDVTVSERTLDAEVGVQPAPVRNSDVSAEAQVKTETDDVRMLKVTDVSAGKVR